MTDSLPDLASAHLQARSAPGPELRGHDGLLPAALCAHGLATPCSLRALTPWSGPSSWEATSLSSVCARGLSWPAPVPASSRLVFCPLRSHATCPAWLVLGGRRAHPHSCSCMWNLVCGFGGAALQGDAGCALCTHGLGRSPECRQHLAGLMWPVFSLPGMKTSGASAFRLLDPAQ